MKTKLDHGHSIFVEKNNLKETKFEELSWHKAITGEQDNFRLYINASEMGIASGQESFQITINKHKNLGDLKKKISHWTEIPADGFTVRR